MLDLAQRHLMLQSSNIFVQWHLMLQSSNVFHNDITFRHYKHTFTHSLLQSIDFFFGLYLGKLLWGNTTSLGWLQHKKTSNTRWSIFFGLKVLFEGYLLCQNHSRLVLGLISLFVTKILVLWVSIISKSLRSSTWSHLIYLGALLIGFLM